MTTPFSQKTLAFLRLLKRNNDRDWFRAHKDDYERYVRQPMIELLARLQRDLRAFAPDIVADPKVSLFRIYRDTRFSEDKSPLKTHVAAQFPSRVFGRSGGAGLYLEIAPGWVWMGGGLYMPEPSELQAVRAHIASTYPRIHRIANAAAFKREAGALAGERLARVPRGYAKDHPAAHYLMFKQFIAGREFPAELAVSRTFYRQLLAVFRAVVPLVRFLNTPLQAQLVPGKTALTDVSAGPVLSVDPPTPRPEPMW